MTWLEHLGITNEQALEILAVSRQAHDAELVQSALIRRIVHGLAVIERTGFDGQRLKDYWVPVNLPKR